MPTVLPLYRQTRMELKYMTGGKKGVMMCDCEEIIGYTHECVVFRLHNEVVKLLGRELWCRSYGNRVAEVIGYIEEIRFGKETE